MNSKSHLSNTKEQIPLEIIGLGIVLNSSGEVLIDQRLDKGRFAGLWEFPGGKQEENELIEHTIVRELREEVGIEVEVCERLISFKYSYELKTLHFHAHICRLISGEPKPLECQQVLWSPVGELSKYPFPKANIRIISALIDYR